MLALFGSQLNAASQLLSQLSQILWDRQKWGFVSADSLLEYQVFNSLSLLYKITQKISQEQIWTNYKSELLLLSNYLNEMLVIDSLPKKFISSIQALTKYPLTVALNKYYIHNLSARELKIDTLLNNPENSDNFNRLLCSIKDAINNDKAKKKSDPYDTLAALTLAFPHIDRKSIEYDVGILTKEGATDIETKGQLSIRYAIQFNMNRVGYETGYPVGDEILRSIIVQVKDLLPTYPPNKMALFTDIMSDLIRYLYQADTFSKEFFKPLYAPSPTDERIFHKHLFDRLVSGDRATYYHYEQENVVGGGRLDIIYTESELTFPIEVKKTDVQPTWELIKTDYAAQVQMYNRPYHQLGFLVVFDINTKKNAKPINDIRSLINILNLETYYSIKDTYPDYVVAIIVPANKVSPNQYTKYH